MEYENTLAKDISGAGKGAAVDASCKRLLADKSILAWILKDCVEEYRNSNSGRKRQRSPAQLSERLPYKSSGQT